MENCELAQRYEGSAQSPVCCRPCAYCRRSSPADMGQGAAASSIRRGLWPIGQHRASGEKKYYLANLAAGMDLRSLAATIKARWICEQAHQQLKEELGLDHFEGRSWHGLHRHALMAMIAYAFLQHRRLKKVRRGKESTARPLNRRCRAVRHAIVDLIMRSVLSDVRTADPGSARKSSVSNPAKVV